MAKAKPTKVPFFQQRIAVIAVALLAAVATAALVWFVLRWMPDLPVREVTFQGAAQRVQPEALARIAGGIRGSLFRTDLAEVKTNVQSVEWVRNADVRRRFPGTLSVTLEEHVAVARWREAGADPDAEHATLVNSFGEVFNANLAADVRDALPLLVGVAPTARDILQKYGELSARLKTIQRVPVEVKLSPRGAWTVRMDNDTTLELGRSDADVRLARFLAAYPQVAELQTPSGHVDLRYPAGLALRKVKPDVSNATKASKT